MTTDQTELEQALQLINNKLFTKVIDAKIESCYQEWLMCKEGEDSIKFKALATAYKDVKQTVLQVAQNLIEAEDDSEVVVQ